MFFGLFKKQEKRAEENNIIGDELRDALLKAGIIYDEVNREMANNIATLEGCIELISNTVAMIPIKLYEDIDGKVQEVKNDIRVKLLNDETGDTLTAFDMKKSMIQDYLMVGNAYVYINKLGLNVQSLHYVDELQVSVVKNSDPIFKDYDIYVYGNKYKPFEFLKVLRNSTDGATGTGIIESNPLLLSVMYNSLRYENISAKTGGNKKGFIKSELSKLDQEAIDNLKNSWQKMYSGNSENCIVLNKGLDFKESSATATELQMNENKETNGNEICKIFNVPPSMITGDGKANESDYEKFIKMAIMPILNNFISNLNRDLLLEREKESFYFAFDMKEVLKADIEKRYKAYEIGLKNGFLGVNDVRYEEDKEPIEAFNDVIKLGLQDVLYNTKKGTIYTPNTDKTSDINLKGGENNANRD